MKIVLGSARTGLIFTGIQEGNPGRDTAGRADPTWPNRAGYSIPCAVMLGSGGGGGAAATLLRLGRAQWRFSPRERFCSAGSVLLISFLYSPFSVSLLFLFPLFAVLLNCPHPYPPVPACFFPFSSAPRRGGGVAAWCFCCRPLPNQNKNKHVYEGVLISVG